MKELKNIIIIIVSNLQVNIEMEKCFIEQDIICTKLMNINLKMVKELFINMMVKL